MGFRWRTGVGGWCRVGGVAVGFRSKEGGGGGEVDCAGADGEEGGGWVGFGGDGAVEGLVAEAEEGAGEVGAHCFCCWGVVNWRWVIGVVCYVGCCEGVRMNGWRMGLR